VGAQTLNQLEYMLQGYSVPGGRYTYDDLQRVLRKIAQLNQ